MPGRRTVRQRFALLDAAIAGVREEARAALDGENGVVPLKEQQGRPLPVSAIAEGKQRVQPANDWRRASGSKPNGRDALGAARGTAREPGNGPGVTRLFSEDVLLRLL